MHCEEIGESDGGSQGSINCDSCGSWMYWAYEGLSDVEGCALRNSEDDYTCSLCSSKGECSLIAEGVSQEAVPSPGDDSTITKRDESSIPTVNMGKDMKVASSYRPSMPTMIEGKILKVLLHMRILV